MRTIVFVLSSCVLALAGCGEPPPKGPQCVAHELGNGVVSIEEPAHGYTCMTRDSAATMADYIGKHPQLNVVVVAASGGSVTVLRTTSKAPSDR